MLGIRVTSFGVYIKPSTKVGIRENAVQRSAIRTALPL
jgi:hypothetical protein